jgi:hypothetical protein
MSARYVFKGSLKRFVSPILSNMPGIESPSVRIVHLNQILPWASMHTVYDNAVTCFLSLHSSWSECPRYHREVAKWLCVYQSVWVQHLCLVTSH